MPWSAAAQRTVLTASARLDPRCTYTGGFDISASNVTLDCRGAVVDGTGQPGVGVLVHAPADADLSRITIRNCVVRGFLNSIRITRDGFRHLAAGREYDDGIRGVVVERVRVSGSTGVGIYVDGYVTRTTIRDSTVTGAGSSGVYSRQARRTTSSRATASSTTAAARTARAGRGSRSAASRSGSGEPGARASPSTARDATASPPTR